MDKALKQRLVGASVLIIFAVIVLPMLLGGRSDTLKQESPSIELPPKPNELSIETRRFPVGIPNQPMPAQGQEADSQKQQQTAVAESQVIKTEAPMAAGPQEVDKTSVSTHTTAGDTETNPLVEPADSAQRVAVKPPVVKSITLSSGRDKGVDVTQASEWAADAPRYLVQVASFSSEKNANALADQLRSDNLPVLMDVVDRPAGRLHRVRVGPYTARAEADALVARLGSTIKDLNPRVLDLRPGDSAPVSEPSDPLVRWVVQVGSFGSAESAEVLVSKLRQAGLPAFSEKVSSANTIAYKVRIGPEVDRDKAAALADKVKAEHQLDAFVTTQE